MSNNLIQVMANLHHLNLFIFEQTLISNISQSQNQINNIAPSFLEFGLGGIGCKRKFGHLRGHLNNNKQTLTQMVRLSI